VTAVTIARATPDAKSAYSIAVTPSEERTNRQAALTMAEILQNPAEKSGKFLTATEPRRRKTGLGAFVHCDS
jgi:hypothetical protein